MTKKVVQEETVEGAPEWMLTFCDCMTLLLTFFVLLISFASFNKDTLPALARTFSEVLPAIGLMSDEKYDALCEEYNNSTLNQRKEGTETPTLAETDKANYMREKKPLDFRNLKVFTIPSEEFFWGQGSAISEEGRGILKALSIFLYQQKGRIVISENGPDGNRALGLSRATAVMRYLVDQQQLEPGRFNISASTMQRHAPDVRQLEITLLDRSVYE